MNSPDQEMWSGLWREARLRGNPGPWYERLTAAYSGPGRRYHNLQHLHECLQEFVPVRHLARQPAAVELALWFHDAIYDPRASDNEEQSAELARQCLMEAAAGDGLLQAVLQLVLATKRHDTSLEADAPLMVDVDLSILGQPAARFQEYEFQIREEYAWVPATVFAEKRAAILAGFLAREHLYATDWFRQKYEAQARTNLQDSIRKLKSASAG